MQHPPPVEWYAFLIILFLIGIVLSWKNMIEEYREMRDGPKDDDNDPPDPFDGEGWAV